MLDLVTFLPAWIENLISFSLSHPKSFSPVLWGFYCFQRLQSNTLDHEVRSMWEYTQGLVWEQEERLHETGSFCQARLVGSVFPNELVNTEHCYVSLFCPLPHLPSWTSFPAPFWELVKNVLLLADAHLSRWFFMFTNKEAACWFEAFLLHVGRQNARLRGAVCKGTSPNGDRDRGSLPLPCKNSCNPAVVRGRNSPSSEFTKGSHLLWFLWI